MKTKLSLRGKIGIVPSLILTIPLFVSIVVFGVLIWLIAKIFKFTGITEAIQFQLNTFDKGVLNGRRLNKTPNKKEPLKSSQNGK